MLNCQTCLKSYKWKEAFAVFPTKNPNNNMKANQNGVIQLSILKDRKRKIYTCFYKQYFYLLSQTEICKKSKKW